jgi:IS5 family transposase
MLQRQRILKLEQLLADIVQTALQKGIRFGSIQVVDSTHSVAHVNTAKEGQREKRGKGPTDPDAQWGCKGQQTMRGPGGTNTTRKKHFYGYKAHVSMNNDNHLITSVITTPGQAYDGHYLQPLIEADVHKQVPVGIVSADRGYDDSRTHYWLERTGIQSAICLKDNRTHKKDSNKKVWLELQANPAYQAGLKERYKIERKFGEGKQQHGLGRCRYRGLERYEIQTLLTAMALNLKRMVKLLYGVNFRNPVAVMA